MKKYKKYLTIGISLIILIFIFILLYKPKKETTIKLGIFSGSMYDVPTMQSYKIIDEAIKKFESENKGIKVKYNYGTLKNDYSEWLSTKILNGETPDIFVILEEDFNTFCSSGVLENFASTISKDKTSGSAKSYEQALALGKIENKQYALPMEIDPTLLFVNKTLMEKEGIKIDKENWTWDEFYRVCKKVTKDTDGDKIIDQFGVVDFTWQDIVYTNGQTLFSQDGKKAEFYKEGVVEAIAFAKKLYRLNNNTKVTIDDFDNGKVLFKPFPFSWYRVYNSYPYKLIRYNGFEWECIKLPKGPKGKNSSKLKSYLIGISSKSKNKDEAWKFLKLLTSDNEVQTNIFRYSQGVPVIKEITESNKTDEELKKYNPEKEITVDKKILGEIIEDSMIIYKFKNYDKVMRQADLNINQVIIENRDIEDNLVKLNKELNELLNQK